MENLKVEIQEWSFTISGLKDIIKLMAEEGTTKVDLLNTELKDLLDILLWADFYFKTNPFKQLKDTAKAPNSY